LEDFLTKPYKRKTRDLTAGILQFIKIKTKWVLLLFLAVSLSALVIYLLDFNYTDNTLFFLLYVIRYSSLILCVFAFYKLLVNIYHIFRRISFFRVLKALLYLLIIVYAAAVIFIEAFIAVISGGNG
jgi:hypothetical protein